MAHPKASAQVAIDPELEARLSALAARSGVSLSELAQSVLRSHADEQERLSEELAEDEHRWQRYLSTGESIPFDVVRAQLRRLAREAAQRAE